MNARTWVTVLTVVGTLLQVAVLVAGAIALRRSYRSAKAVMDAAMSPDPAQRPEPTTTYQHALYVREMITEQILRHSWRQAVGGLGLLIIGAVLTGAAGIWGLFLPSLS